MSISRQNLSIVIVTFKSENVIHECLKSIGNEIPITIIENSNNSKFKHDLEKKYKNVKCVLSGQNLGMGPANNLGINSTKNEYILILNPDVILEHNTIDELILASKHIPNFAILSPVSKNKEYPNYKMFKNHKEKIANNLPIKVLSVDGYAMLFNRKNMNEMIVQKDNNKNYFDENFFMYLENDDLCKRVIDNKKDIYIAPNSMLEHLGAQAVDSKYKYEVELSRNWHWMWSKFYFNKKHYGYVSAFIKIFSNLISAKIKFIYYLIIFNHHKRKIYLMRLLGLIYSMLGKKSSYRPKI